MMVRIVGVRIGTPSYLAWLGPLEKFQRFLHRIILGLLFQESARREASVVGVFLGFCWLPIGGELLATWCFTSFSYADVVIHVAASDRQVVFVLAIKLSFFFMFAFQNLHPYHVERREWWLRYT
jgi:hypothetical protein